MSDLLKDKISELVFFDGNRGRFFMCIVLLFTVKKRFLPRFIEFFTAHSFLFYNLKNRILKFLLLLLTFTIFITLTSFCAKYRERPYCFSRIFLTLDGINTILEFVKSNTLIHLFRELHFCLKFWDRTTFNNSNII